MMNERDLEQRNLQYGTVKKKADLLKRTGVSPNKIRHGVKKFDEPVPGVLSEAGDYAADLLDFLLDYDTEYYEQFPEASLREDIVDYVKGEVWIIKHKARTIEDDKCMVAMDLRKCLKDSITSFAQIAGRTVKNVAEGLPMPEKRELRELMIDAAEESIEITYGRPLRNINLLERKDN